MAHNARRGAGDGGVLRDALCCGVCIAAALRWRHATQDAAPLLVQLRLTFCFSAIQ